MLTPSCLRVYTSRACSMAMRASAACTLPTCLCSSPERARMNTSKSGHSVSRALIANSSRCCLHCALFLLRCMRNGRLANPTAFFMRALTRGQPLAIARAIAFQYAVEFRPVDGAELIVLGGFVPAQGLIRHLQAQELRLRNRHIDKVLAQLIIGESFDLPAHGLRRVLRLRIARPEHHERRPPPA